MKARQSRAGAELVAEIWLLDIQVWMKATTVCRSNVSEVGIEFKNAQVV
jgi:hypothetical protein